MTVVVAFVTADAALMASDTEGTESDGSRHETDKIWTCGSLLCGYTGTSVIWQPLRAALEADVPAAEAGGAINRWAMRQRICQTAHAVFAAEYGYRVPALPGHVPPELNGTLLAIGRDDNGYWLLEVTGNAGASFYEHIGFHTVGSGSLAAQMAGGMLRNYEAVGRQRPHLRLIAYRTVAACIDILGSQYGVGGEVAMWDAEGGAPFTRLDPQAMQQVANGVEQWMTVEAESLDRVVLEDVAPGADAGVAMPADLEPQAAAAAAAAAAGDQPADDDGPQADAVPAPA